MVIKTGWLYLQVQTISGPGTFARHSHLVYKCGSWASASIFWYYLYMYFRCSSMHVLLMCWYEWNKRAQKIWELHKKWNGCEQSVLLQCSMSILLPVLMWPRSISIPAAEPGISCVVFINCTHNSIAKYRSNTVNTWLRIIVSHLTNMSECLLPVFCTTKRVWSRDCEIPQSELGVFHVISTFCATCVPQNAEITRKIPSSAQCFQKQMVGFL